MGDTVSTNTPNTRHTSPPADQLPSDLHEAVTTALTAAMDAGLDKRLCDALETSLTAAAPGLSPADETRGVGVPVRRLLEEQVLLERCLVLGLLMVTYYRPHTVRQAIIKRRVVEATHKW